MIAGSEPAVLLARWLDELVYRAESDDLVPEDVGGVELGQRGPRATARCQRGDAAAWSRRPFYRLAFDLSRASTVATSRSLAFR